MRLDKYNLSSLSSNLLAHGIRSEQMQSRQNDSLEVKMNDPFLGPDWGSHHRVMSDGIDKLFVSVFTWLKSRVKGSAGTDPTAAPFECDGCAVPCCEQ